MMSDSAEVPDLRELTFLWHHYMAATDVWKAELRPQVKHLRKKESRRALDVYNKALETYNAAQSPELWSATDGDRSCS